jgi:hypothetical protein
LVFHLGLDVCPLAFHLGLDVCPLAFHLGLDVCREVILGSVGHPLFLSCLGWDYCPSHHQPSKNPTMAVVLSRIHRA